MVHEATTSNASSGQFAWRLPADTSAIPPARHAFEAWLRDVGAGADDVHDLAVVLSELASNAALGAPTGTTATIEASAQRGVVELEVCNEVDAAQADVLRWDLDDPLRGGGRGLLIVRAYTDTMEVDSAGGTVTVRCARRLDAWS